MMLCLNSFHFWNNDKLKYDLFVTSTPVSLNTHLTWHYHVKWCLLWPDWQADEIIFSFFEFFFYIVCFLEGYSKLQLLSNNFLILTIEYWIELNFKGYLGATLLVFNMSEFAPDKTIWIIGDELTRNNKEQWRCSDDERGLGLTWSWHESLMASLHATTLENHRQRYIRRLMRSN